jgi:hypothetical protein
MTTAKVPRILTAFGAGLLTLVVVPLVVVLLAPTARAAAAKFYFRLGEVKVAPNVGAGAGAGAGAEVDADLKTYAAEALKAELASRPEWASDVGTRENDPEALAAELKKRNLRGFSVTVSFEQLKKELKEPSPGGRRKRAVVNVKLSVFGTTIPEEKLSFSGDGESGVEAEVSDKSAVAETQALAKDAVKDAVKQAVDQALMKLSIGKSAPMNEKKHAKKKK